MKRTLSLLIYSFVILATIGAAYAIPNGATLTEGTPETASPAAADSVLAEGGNVTSLDVAGQSVTRVWQGFFGQVSGNLTLEDATGDQFFNWSIGTPNGTVLASRNSTIDWTTVDAVTDCDVDTDLTAQGRDRVSRTFEQNVTISPAIQIGTVSITDACQVFTHTSGSPGFNFEEIIANATGVDTIYVSRINPDATGFDGNTYDYQMIVPDNRTAALTTYFFFVEFL